MSNEQRDYNTTLLGLYRKKTGNYMSMKVDHRTIDALLSVVEGGKIMLKIVPLERKRDDHYPDAYLEFISPAKVKEYEESRPPEGNAPRRGSADESL